MHTARSEGRAAQCVLRAAGTAHRPRLIFGGLMLLALATGRASVTDPLAFVLLGARLVQSGIHLSSLSSTAVTLRFSAFAVQMGIAVL